MTMPAWFLIVSAAISGIEALMPAAAALIAQLDPAHSATPNATAAVSHVAAAAAHLTRAAQALHPSAA
jgi:hypothetical protein